MQKNMKRTAAVLGGVYHSVQNRLPTESKADSVQIQSALVPTEISHSRAAKSLNNEDKSESEPHVAFLSSTYSSVSEQSSIDQLNDDDMSISNALRLVDNHFNNNVRNLGSLLASHQPRLDLVSNASTILFSSTQRIFPAEFQRDVQDSARNILQDPTLMKGFLADLSGSGSNQKSITYATDVKWIVPPQFTCSICLDVLNCPFNIPCGHSFCMECLECLHQDFEQLDCPECREPCKKNEGSFEITLNSVIEDFVDSLDDSVEKTAWQRKHMMLIKRISSKRLSKVKNDRGFEYAMYAIGIVVVVVVSLLLKRKL